ncbi:phthiocerol/phenolphthiocerol synthesis type-I polyketide synthase C [Kutzneria buriramensis]|uniref:Phthiocerol/phenolphthiocerol synthesis type-I polyketide synthase C n=2 Tax=Kutzneria buriramensis TaxID=1045776 RepID=A0A3E0GUN4_9PSEU|nr:phthiocerol/phenolphthiocerol synthesis type-I polyketide synthase C [Kutzneria buriramensis]
MTAKRIPVAVVGMAGRFPGARNVEEFWRLLVDRRDMIEAPPAGRTRLGRPVGNLPAQGGFLPDIDRFDAAFFNISPREAAVIDPQQRLMLETAWHAIEDSGTRAQDLRGSSTGVWMGGLWHDYELLRKDAGEQATRHSIFGGSLDMLAARVSYFLGLRGPSLTVESSCSSSLVAVHLACQALASGEVDGALVGGCNLVLSQEVSAGLAEFGGLSPTGRCRPFGVGADGFVRGEGVAVVHLKTLAAARRDGDRVRAVIAASAVNNDGGGESLVTPSPHAQEQLLRGVYGADGVAPELVDYVEAHGTGTLRGDPIEAVALGRVLGRGDAPLPIGSVKGNIGHLEPAAGLAGLVKAVLCLENQMVPPSLHADVTNPSIDLDGLGLRVANTPVALDPERDVHIGVNSFGWGGTNAHVVLRREHGETPPANPACAGPPTVRLSAHSSEVLEVRERDVMGVLDNSRGLAEASALADTLAWRRDHFAERVALTVTSDQPDGPRLIDRVAGRARTPQLVAFAFPGQGAQWNGMGAGLYGVDDAFTRTLDRCAEALLSETGWDVRESLCDGQADRPSEPVDRIQPASWAMAVALASAWRNAGVRPDVLVGHSQGEIAAATDAGILSIADGAAVVARRSRILRAVAGRGRMLMVDMDLDAATRALAGFEKTVSIAAHNGPRSCVLAGDGEYVLLLKEILDAQDVYCRLIDVDYASHSPQVEPLLADIRAALASLQPRPGHTPLLSTVTLRREAGDRWGGSYWAENLRSRVRFAEAVSQLVDDGLSHVVEVSPHPVLGPALNEIVARAERQPAVLETLRRGARSSRDFAVASARAWVSGLAANGPQPRSRPAAALPAYPFGGRRYWVAEESGGGRAASPARLTLLPTPVPGLSTATTQLGVAGSRWLADHRVEDEIVVPAGAYLNILAAAADAENPLGRLHLTDLVFTTPLLVGTAPTTVAITWRRADGGASVSLRSQGEAGDGDQAARWTEHLHGRNRLHTTALPAADFPSSILSTVPDREDLFYQSCAARGLRYGPAFRTVTSVRRAADEALVSLSLPGSVAADPDAGTLHSVLWDGILQAGLAVEPIETAVLPAGLTEVSLDLLKPGAVRELWAHARRSRPGHYDIAIFDADRKHVGHVHGLRLAPLASGAEQPEDDVFSLRLEESPTLPQARETMAETTAVVCGLRTTAGRVRELACALGTRHSVFEDDQDALNHLAAVRADHVLFVAPEGDEGTGAARLGILCLARVVGHLAEANHETRLTVVTVNGLATESAGPPDACATQYLGLVGVVQTEHPRLQARLIDLDPEGEPATPAMIDGDDDIVAFRGGRRFVGRRRRGSLPGPPVTWANRSRQPFALVARTPGRLDSVVGRFFARTRPAVGQVEVEVAAAALNFLDVVKAMGVYPDRSDEGRLGLECVGTVVAVGDDVRDVAPGDRVIACAERALASHVIVDRRHLVHAPASLDDAVAAALPIAYVTAWYSLVDVASVAAGETVLVHSAAGGVGQAAIHVARSRGARVIGTAGSDTKRALVRSLGVDHVFDSRDGNWPDRVREVAPEGVDVVLNSLPGEAIQAGLAVLAADGRFVELGKRDLYANSAVELAPFRNAVSMTAVDVLGMMRRRPGRFERVLRTVMAAVDEGVLPLLPVTSYAFADAERALRDMASGQTTGKLVLENPAGLPAVQPRPLAQGRFPSPGTHLITGGLGALGLSLAEFLVAHGVQDLVLLGRTPPADSARRRVEGLRAAGCRVETVAADVADAGQLAEALANVRALGMPPICGVFHLAGVLADATLTEIDRDDLDAVLAPKVAGVINLDQLTIDDPVEWFVCFSSVAAFVGSPGQGAYAAANAFLDGLMTRRRATGRSGLSIQWGPVADVGLAAVDGIRGDRLENRGLAGRTVNTCWPAMLRFLERDDTVVAYAGLDPHQWSQSYPATAALTSWRALLDEASPEPPVFGAATAHPKVSRTQVSDIVRASAADVLRMQDDIEDDVPLRTLGLDSLMSLELRNVLEAKLGTKLSPTLLWKFPSIRALSGALADLVPADTEEPGDG